jgi:hypothetical protein
MTPTSNLDANPHPQSTSSIDLSPLPYYPSHRLWHMVVMIARTSLGRTVPRGLRSACCQQKRGLAAAASGSFSYETGEAGGVKLASRDVPGPTTTVAVVARAGTRFQPLPGLTEGLEKFAFKVWNELVIAGS